MEYDQSSPDLFILTPNRHSNRRQKTMIHTQESALTSVGADFFTPDQINGQIRLHNERSKGGEQSELYTIQRKEVNDIELLTAIWNAATHPLIATLLVIKIIGALLIKIAHR